VFHTVVSCETGTITIWEAELLRWSFQRAGEPGPITFLVSERDKRSGLTWSTPMAPGPDLMPVKNWTWVDGDYYPPYNRPYSLLDWYQRGGPQADTVLIVDPDFMWLEQLGDLRVPPGRISAERWGQMDRFAGKYGAPAIGVPYLVSTSDLGELLPRYVDQTRAMRVAKENFGMGESGQWMAEMGGFSLAVRDAGLRVDPIILDCGPVIHYNHPQAHCSTGFAKTEYRPWASVPVPSSGPGRRFAELLNEYVGSRVNLV
jgi:hypothetical protein